MNWQHAAFASMLIVATSRPSFTHSFSATSRVVGNVRPMASVVVPTSRPPSTTTTNHRKGRRCSTVELRAGGGGGGGGSIGDSGATAALGLAGILASATMMYSESASSTGWPRPVRSLVRCCRGRYTGVVCLVRFSHSTRLYGCHIYGITGIVVLVAQVTNYGYIPNAVPVEGGMCSWIIPDVCFSSIEQF
ncbi:hypothetical protein ACHAW5_001284 [Stephanodiscus triporus]|uniref:Uncharacterized protein n=1 Tax=Stephanodiscus triporus TaxID=2934178 RepID=A0ABD3MYS1_9STRA